MFTGTAGTRLGTNLGVRARSRTKRYEDASEGEDEDLPVSKSDKEISTDDANAVVSTSNSKKEKQGGNINEVERKVIRKELLALFNHIDSSNTWEPSFKPEFAQQFKSWTNQVKAAETFDEFKGLLVKLEDGINNSHKCRRWIPIMSDLER
ncbi:hypothetical protein TL16_g10984 [Triparma laevis f. inornata]|uniref:Uncharacterized protein n=1 Tax=Triparma laevis f. inornata TaxID=1714386 RepID=A0A9W7BJJ9_9STRA|nr:hypothetical protein TL16_g10984 [Triparma laevis f. inornata]